MGGVLLALLRTRSAGCKAGLGLRAEDAEVRLGLPDEDATGGLARVGTVEAKPNAPDKIRDVRLGEIGVGAARTGCRALKALLDAAHEQVTIESSRAWVCSQHVSKCHRSPFVRAVARGPKATTSAALRGSEDEATERMGIGTA